ncbi:hypothetical protein GIB67_030412 [Kingdonia uniflora]|uniref:Uncharacterized protein n=1 Tax=Kingdonia uniflora TaxID=39325 RepID=A0A7J7NE00_9MAGN|nr:hypothetical protein GIB67_030412 [Kingdonia uniflora]
MEVSLKVINVACFSLLVITWVLIEFLKQKKRDVEDEGLKEGALPRKSTVFAKITVISNILISILYLSFCFYEIFKLKTLSLESVLKASVWVIVTLFAFYLSNKTFNKRWPLVLVVWWLFSTILNTVNISIYLLAHLNSNKFPNFLPEANVADFASLPLLILLCFNALRVNYVQKLQEFKHPLLHREVNDVLRDVDPFANAGICSLLTFQWLNPFFSEGRIRKLELHQIPSAAESETAEKSFSLLQESFRKQNTETFSLSKAILHSTWKSLAINAVFAGKVPQSDLVFQIFISSRFVSTSPSFYVLFFVDINLMGP